MNQEVRASYVVTATTIFTPQMLTSTRRYGKVKIFITTGLKWMGCGIYPALLGNLHRLQLFSIQPQLFIILKPRNMPHHGNLFNSIRHMFNFFISTVSRRICLRLLPVFFFKSPHNMHRKQLQAKGSISPSFALYILASVPNCPHCSAFCACLIIV